MVLTRDAYICVFETQKGYGETLAKQRKHNTKARNVMQHHINTKTILKADR